MSRMWIVPEGRRGHSTIFLVGIKGPLCHLYHGGCAVLAGTPLVGAGCGKHEPLRLWVEDSNFAPRYREMELLELHLQLTVEPART